MVKNKPNRPLSRLINHFNKDAPPSDTQHLTISPPQDSIGRSLSPTVSCIARNLPASDKLSRKLSSVSLNPRPLGIDATPWSVPSIWALARDSTPFRVRRMHSCGNPACTNQPPRISQPGIYSLWPQGVLVFALPLGVPSTAVARPDWPPSAAGSLPAGALSSALVAG
jgi:hypothetical protein